VVEFGEGLEGFLAAVERALADTPERKRRRLQRASENSWESRVQFMMHHINAALQRRQAGARR
ncbi:MAG: hypothetical protein NUV35_06975, partial [Syntrophomonadaceae bacterium]|jgi:uncharacterized secreted protein with C-terminal beta-propeller domain|nr:hypothetical protein [Syntrophomonadaceae bacterium]